MASILGAALLDAACASNVVGDSMGTGSGGHASASITSASGTSSGVSTSGTSTGGGSCDAATLCKGPSGDAIPGCLSPCGGIDAIACPSGDFVCLTIYPTLNYDGPQGVCLPPASTTCTVDADCACLPGDCSYWVGATSDTARWACSMGGCGASCN